MVVLVFLVWWFNEERTGGGGAEPSQTTGSSAVSDERPGGQVDEAGADTPTVAAAESTVVEVVAVDVTDEPPARPGDGTSDGTVAQPDPEPPVAVAAISPDDILVLEDLENNWGGYYVIHISSFRDSGKARTEVAQLTARGFPVFIVFLNLGAKGSWYRVYAGPVVSREDARNTKKLLDDTPGVRFTRITQIAN